MPGYVIHLTFAKLVSDKIKVSEKLKLNDENSFFTGALISDACSKDGDKGKKKSHFCKDMKTLFKNPSLEMFLEKYGTSLDNEVMLGIYTHLYLDKYYYNEFLYNIFEFSSDTMTNKKTGEVLKIWEDFFVRHGIYKEYSAMNKMFLADFDIKPELLDFKIVSGKMPEMEEYDFDKLKKFKEKLMNFINEDEEYEGRLLKYTDILEFLENLSIRFVNELYNNKMSNN